MRFAKNRAGFTIVEGIFILAIVAAIGGLLWYGLHAKKAQTSATQAAKTVTAATTDTPLKLKSIGFNLDYYDPATNHAGDMVFTHSDHDLSGQFHLIFADFGTQDPRSPSDPTKRNVQPTFILPLGTKVHALVDGVVTDVKDLYSGDQTIWVARDDKSQYTYETEHINNPVVKKGDQVTGGQVIGEVSSHDSDHHPGFGIVEIGILYTRTGQPQHICPFAYLDDSIKDDMQKKILAVHKAWEDYVGMPSLYDDAHAASPGCFTLDPVNG